jgi:heme-degrading monooxygenase HmoA
MIAATVHGIREKLPSWQCGIGDADDLPYLRGWATEANADAYERLLRSEVIVGILRREISGFRAIDLLRRSVPEGAEFVTLMWFDSLEAVQSFAGPDYEMAVVPAEARQLLLRFETR